MQALDLHLTSNPINHPCPKLRWVFGMNHMTPWESEIALSTKVYVRPSNSWNPFPRLFLGRGKPPSLHRGRLGGWIQWVQSVQVVRSLRSVRAVRSGRVKDILTREDCQSREDFEIRKFVANHVDFIFGPTLWVVLGAKWNSSANQVAVNSTAHTRCTKQSSAAKRE